MGIFGFACGRCWERDCKCTPDELEAYNIQAEINRNTPIKRETPTLDSLRKQLGEDFRNKEPEPGPIIFVSTDGDDYSVLDRVDPRVKEQALAGNLTLSDVGNVGVRLSIRDEDGSPRYCQLAKNETFRPIKEADEDTLEAALGPCEETLTPENKYWILLSLCFKPVGKHQWSHPVLGDETIWFDIETDHLILLISRVFKEGYKDYKNSLKEWASQQKQAT